MTLQAAIYMHNEQRLATKRLPDGDTATLTWYAL